MKFFMFGVLIISCLSVNNVQSAVYLNNTLRIQPRAGMGDIVKNLMEEFRKRLCHEIPKFGLPKLDPFGIDEKSFEIKVDPADLKLKINDLSVTGLNSFFFTTLNIKPTLSVEIDVSITYLHLTSDYKVKGAIKDLLDIDGEGDVSLKLKNLNLKFAGKLRKKETQPFGLIIEKLVPSFEISSFRINNLFPVEDLNDFISELVKDMGVEIFNDLWLEHNMTVQNMVEEFADKKLIDYDAVKLSQAIQNAGNIFDENDPKPDCSFDQLM